MFKNWLQLKKVIKISLPFGMRLETHRQPHWWQCPLATAQWHLAMHCCRRAALLSWRSDSGGSAHHWVIITISDEGLRRKPFPQKKHRPFCFSVCFWFLWAWSIVGKFICVESSADPVIFYIAVVQQIFSLLEHSDEPLLLLLDSLSLSTVT